MPDLTDQSASGTDDYLIYEAVIYLVQMATRSTKLLFTWHRWLLDLPGLSTPGTYGYLIYQAVLDQVYEIFVQDQQSSKSGI